MPDPLRTLWAYLDRLREAFGTSYVVAVVLIYGVNQGMGERFLYSAQQFFVYDTLGLGSAEYGLIEGFSKIPWQLKSLFGLLSDVLPWNGRHRSPYMLLAGCLGIIGTTLLAVLPAPIMSSSLAAALFLVGNFNFAVPDVMIDATVAERAKLHPSRAADLQALCWGSLGLFQIPAGISKGYLLEAAGPRLLFSLSIATAGCVIVPPALGWLGERAQPHGACASAAHSRRLCGQLMSEEHRRRIVAAAGIVGIYALGLGLCQLLAGASYPAAVGVLTLLGNSLLCASLYAVLRRVDECLARALLFSFLKGAICPRSRIVFEWAHAPVPSHAGSGGGDGAGGGGRGDDRRCWDADMCASYEGALSEAAASAIAATTAAVIGGNGSVNASGADGLALGALPCGWARMRGQPCLPPTVFAWVDVAASAALAVGTALYASCFQTWSYRRIIGTTQALLVAANFVDVLWVTRANLPLGVPDTLIAFGEETLVDVMDAINSQPFYIFAAKLCPPGVEASMFALFMGLSNFGTAAGRYIGSSLIQAMGGISAPAYKGLTEYLVLRSLTRFLPCLLVPFLVPMGSPADTARAMGAGKGVTESEPEGGGAAPDAHARRSGRGGEEYLPSELQELHEPPFGPFASPPHLQQAMTIAAAGGELVHAAHV